MSLLNGIFVLTMVVVAGGKMFLALLLSLLAVPWTSLPKRASQQIYPYWRFFYASFLKPHTTVSTNGQRDALENFYSSQADAYDVTRAGLLKGREEMLCLAAAQLRFRETREDMPKHRIWVDVRLPLPKTALPLNLPLDWWWDWIQYRSNATFH
jgi:betaine lipid synthase